MNKIRLYLVVLLAIAFSSCIGDEFVEEKDSSDKELILTLAYSNQIANGVTASSRATKVENEEDLLNENKIEKVDIFFYTKGGELTWHVESAAMRIEDGEDHTKKLTLRATKEKASELNNNNYKLVVLVNGPDREKITGKSYDELQQMVYTKNLDATEGPLDSFLMDGEKETGTIELDKEKPYNLGNIELSRAAAKIRVLINNIKVDGYIAGTPALKLVNYTETTALLSGKPLKAPTYKEPTEQNLIKGDKTPYTTNYPLYSFENDWKEDDSKMTYLLLKIPFSDTTEKKEADYYYRVPIYYSIDSENSFSIKRNHLYEVNIDIERLGASTEELPVELSGKIDIEPWDNKEEAIHAQLHKANYLVVKETELDMMNVAEKKIEYISNSTLKVKNSTLKAYYFKYDTNGNSQKVNLPQTNNPLPQISFTKSDRKTFIQINKEVPINYAPLYIEFTVQNEAGLEEKVNITQYPPRYITGVNPTNKEYYKGTEGSPKSNTTLFTVTTVVPVKGDIIGDPTDRNGKTGTDELSNKIISPQFMIASQLGVTYERFLDEDEYNIFGKLTAESGETRCSKYWERNYGDESEVLLDGIKYSGKWRLPTKAEIEYIQRIQRDENSSVKSLLEGQKYWSAYHYAYYNFFKGYWPYADKSSTAHIRCVFDIYKSKPTKR